LIAAAESTSALDEGGISFRVERAVLESLDHGDQGFRALRKLHAPVGELYQQTGFLTGYSERV
jgi:hypothetical protein